MSKYAKGWQQGMSEKETRNLAYFERNMLAVLMAKESNDHCKSLGLEPDSGYYVHGAWEGWSRVVSIYNGGITFHVPDDFDIGEDIPLIHPNWNGHSTEEKWKFVADLLEMELEE
jgi:hypothetical protein